MFVHNIQFKWKPGTTAAEVEEMKAALATLPGAVPSIRSYIFGSDLGLAAQSGNSWDFAIVAQFDDQAGWKEYLDHPVHDKVRAEVLAPRIAERASVQFEY